MADYRVTVGVYVEDESLETLKTQINGLKTEKIKVTADTDGFKKSLNSVNKALRRFEKPAEVKLHLNTKGALREISAIQRSLDKLQSTKVAPNIGGTGKAKSAGLGLNPAGVEKDLKRIKRAYKEISTLTAKKIKLNGLNNAGEIAEMEAQLDRAKVKAMALRSTLETKMGAKNFATEMGEDFEKAINKIALAEAKVGDVKQKLYSKIQSSYSGSANLSKMFDVDNKINNLSTVNQTTTASVEKLRVAYTNLGHALKSGDVDKAITAQKRFEDALEETNYAIKKNQALNKNMASSQSLNLGRQRLGNDIDVWLRQNTIAAREFENELDVLRAKLKTCDSVELGNLRSEFNKLKTDAQLAGKTGMSFTDNIKDKFSRLGGYMVASMGIMEAVMLMRSMVDAVLQVDTAMTELYRVTDLTNSGYEELYQNMTASAKEYGVVLSDLVASTAAWARLGFDTDTANRMAEISAMYQHIGDVDYETAVENLVTGFKGFEGQLGTMFGDDDAAAMQYIADIYNELGNNFAIGSDQVGDSLTRAASALSMAGNSIEESAGMVTAVTEVTQDPEKAGTAMKILSLRLRGMKGELEDMGEPIDENVEDISKMQQQIFKMTGEKVNIFDDMGNFKSTYDIMQDISAVWDDLTSVQQADLLETIAGKNRANEVAALISNWSQAEAAAKTAEDATGSASAEHAKYMDSLAGRINTFKATWQVLSNTLVDSDALKGLVSGATSFLNVLDEIINTLGLLPTLLGGLAGGMAMFKTMQRNKKGEMGLGFNLKKDQFGNNVGMQFGKTGFKNNMLGKSYNQGYSQGFKFDPAFQKQVDTDRAALARLDAALQKTKSKVMSFKEVEKHMAGASKQAVEYAKYNQQNLLGGDNLKKLGLQDRQAAVGLAAQDKSLKNVGRLMKEYNTGCKTAGMNQEQFASAVGQGNAVLGKYMSGLGKANGNMMGYIKTLISTKGASIALQGATLALNGVLSMAGGILATLAIGAAISGIMKLVNAEEDLANSVADATAKYQEQKSALGDTGNFESLAQRYKELSAGVDGTGMNMSLSTAEYDEYKSVVTELAGLMPELVNGYNAEGVAILSCAGSYDALAEARERAVVANSKELKEGGKDIFKDFEYAKNDLKSKGISGFEELDGFFKGQYESIDQALSEWDDQTERLLIERLRSEGVEIPEGGTTSEQLKSLLQGEPEKCKAVVNDFFADVEAELSSVKSLADAHLAEMFASSGSGFEFSEQMQNAITNVAGSLDYTFYSQFETAEEMYEGLNKILTDFSEIDQTLLPDSLDMLSDFNAGDIGLGEYYNQIEQVTAATADWDEATQQAINDMLNIEQVSDIYKNVTRDIEGIADLDLSGYGSIEEYVNQLTASQAAAIIQVIPEFDGDSLEDLNDAIREHTLMTPVDISIQAESESLEKFNSAIAESTTASGLSADAIAALETRYASLESKGYDVSQVFENTANGIHLNAQAYAELEDAYNNENMSEMSQKISDLKDKHAELTAELNQAKRTGADTSAIELEISQVEQLIGDTEQLKSQYQGLTSAYNQWQTAAQAGEERDMYESVGEGLKAMEESLKDGWLDTADRRLLELVTGQDMLTVSAQECVKSYKGLDKAINSAGYSVNDFFTYDDEGNATATGIKQFWETVDAAEKEIGKNIVKKNKDGNIIGFDFDIDDKAAIAEALGVSEELVDIFVRASADAGFTVDMDGNMTALSEIRESAEKAYESLKKIDKNTFEFDFDATSGEALTTNLNEAKKLLENEDFYVDGKFNMDAKGAKDAYEIASYFQSMEDQGTYSAYLQMDTTSASEELKQPLQQIQEFANLSMQKHQLELIGGDTSEIDAQLDSVAKNLHEIDNMEVKAQLGIDGMTEEEIASALESGEVKVPGTVDFEANMSSSMSKIADYISVLTGQMTQEEFNLKYPVQIEPDVKDEKLKEGQEEVKKEIEKAESKMQEVGSEPIDVNVNIEAKAENIEKIESSIETVKSKMQEINSSSIAPEVKAAQLDDAKAKLELLISKKTEASQPTFMSLDSSQVDSSLADALSKVQAYQSALNEVNMMSELKEAGIEIDDSEITAAQQKAEECLAAIQGLDGDVKVAIGLEENGDMNSIQQSFANGEIQFAISTSEASTQVQQLTKEFEQVQDKEAKIEVDVEGLDKVKELNSNMELAANVEGSVSNLSEFVEGAKELSKLDSNIVTDVNASVSGNVIDTSEIKLNNLKVFADSAKNLGDVGSPISDVTANVHGNVLDKFEMSIDNLGVFAENAKDIGNIGTVEANVTANMHGNVGGFSDEGIGRLPEFAEGAEMLLGIGDVTTNVTANMTGNVGGIFDEGIDRLPEFATGAEALSGIGDVETNVTANMTGNVGGIFDEGIDRIPKFAENAKMLAEVGKDVSVSVTANMTGNVGGVFDEGIDRIPKFAEGASALQGLESKSVTIEANMTGNVGGIFDEGIGRLPEFAAGASAIQDLESKEITIEANMGGTLGGVFDEGIGRLPEFAAGAEAIQDLESKEVTIEANMGGTLGGFFDEGISRLPEFAAGAEAIQNLESKTVSIEANMGGTLGGVFDEGVDRLPEFAAGAESLQGLQSKEVNITANMSGNLGGVFDEGIGRLKEFADGAAALQGIDTITADVTANLHGNLGGFSDEGSGRLKEFADGANELKGINTIKADVTANLRGNIGGLSDEGSSRLPAFAKGAKQLKDVGDVTTNVTANLKGNISEKSGSIESLSSFAKAAKKFQDLESKKVTVTANIKGKLTDDKVAKLVKFKDAVKGLPKSTTVTVTTNANVEKITNVTNALKSLSDSGVMKTHTANVNVSVSGKDAITTVKNAISNIANKTVSIVAKVTGLNPINALKSAIKGLKGKSVKVNETGSAAAKSRVDGLKASINGLGSKSISVSVSTGDAVTKINNVVTALSKIKNKNVKISVTTSSSSAGEAAGTAHASGNAFARGKWGIDGSGVALGGELGQEIVVRDGRFFTIGDKGAEFFHYKKNDIIFNATQTAALFKYGGIKGANPRGKMLATGSAFVKGSTSGRAFGYNATGGFLGDVETSSPAATVTTTTTTTGTTTPKTKTTPKDTKKEFEETFDWVEKKIKKVEKALERLNKTAEDTFKNWTNRNKALDKSITQLRNNIQTLRSAYQEYMKQANDITFYKWDKDKKKWVYDKAYDQQMKKNLQEGKIDISKVTNETRANKMQEYLEWWDKAQDTLDKIDQASAELAEKYVEKFNNIITKYEGKLAEFEHHLSMIEQRISQAEARGLNVSTAYYKQMIKEEKKSIQQMEKEKAEALKALETAVRTGAVQIGSEEWQAMVDEIDGISLSIEESKTSIAEWEQQIQELEWESFDNLMEKIGNITKETEFLIDLLGSKELYNKDTGELTEAGMATMGMHAQNYNVHMEEAARYQEEIDSMGNVSTLTPEQIERRNELIEAQREAILAAEDEKQAIRDMVEEGIQYELDAMQERIDKYNEALESQKDLYEYQKKVKEQTKEIADIEKQLAVYAGDDSEEARQKVQKLQMQLENAKTELEETEYDKYLSGQEDLLDDLYTQYEELLNARLDNIDELVTDMIEDINANSDAIQKTIESAAASVGYTVSQAVIGAWSGNGDAVGNYSGGQAEGSTGTATQVAGVETQHDATDPTNPDSAAYQQAAQDAQPPASAADSPEATNAKQGDGKVQIYDLVKLKKGTGVYSTATGKTSDGKKSTYKKTTKQENKLFITGIAKNSNGNLKAFPYRLSWRRDRATGDFGWVRRFAKNAQGKKTRENFTGYATGAEKILSDQIAWTQEQGQEFIVRPSDGAILTPLKKGDSVLNAVATSNIWDMANDPAEFIKENLGVDMGDTPVIQNAIASYTQNLDNVTFSFPSVRNYEEMLSMMQRDKNFERLLLSMTIDQIAGKSALGVGKSIR